MVGWWVVQRDGWLVGWLVWRKKVGCLLAGLVGWPVGWCWLFVQPNNQPTNRIDKTHENNEADTSVHSDTDAPSMYTIHRHTGTSDIPRHQFQRYTHDPIHRFINSLRSDPIQHHTYSPIYLGTAQRSDTQTHRITDTDALTYRYTDTPQCVPTHRCCPPRCGRRYSAALPAPRRHYFRSGRSSSMPALSGAANA